MMGRSRDNTSREELHHMLPVQSSFPDFAKYCERSDSQSGSSESSSADNALWNEDFAHRPSWCDAGLAYQQIKKGRASGNKCAIWLRALLQRLLFRLGCFIQSHSSGVLFIGILILTTCSVGLWKASVETNMEKLWVERGGRLDNERAFIRSISSLQAGLGGNDDGGLSGGGNMAQYLVLIQTPKQKGLDILSEEELLLHAEVLRNVSQLTVEMYGEKWQLSDLCFKPPAPMLEVSISEWSNIVTSLLDRIIPCIIISPLDCFWEGSIPLGPFPPMSIPEEVTVFIPSLHGQLTWKNLDPAAVVDDAGLVIGDTETIRNLFLRAGVDHGYLNRPCLNPLDPECPRAAPNYLDVCHVVEKYLLYTNRSSIYDEPVVNAVLQSSIEVDAGNLTSPNATTNSAVETSNASITNPDANLNDAIWLFQRPETQTSSFESKRLLPGLCSKHADEVRRLARADNTFLSRIGVAVEHINFGQEMTGGCKGFAQKFMQWPEDLIIGGVKRQSDQILTAEALQSVLMISSPSDVYHRFKDHGPKSRLNLDQWTYQAADNVLKKWQRKYTDYIYNHVNNSGQDDRRLHPLAGTSVNDMLAEFSRFNPTVILVGYVLMIVYAAASLCSCAERGVRSSVGLAVAGCLMVTFASVAGLGLSMWIGVTFNAATTQIVPFLTLGLGVDDMFLLVHNYKEIVKYVHRDEIGFLLKETGLSALLTSINNIVAFLAGGMMPVPALRDFCLQVAMLLCFNAVTVLTLYPAVMSIDLDRRKRRRVDVFCCIKIKNDKVQPKSSSVDNDSVDMTRDYDNDEATGRQSVNNNNNNSMESVLIQSTTGNGIGNGTGGTDGRCGLANPVAASDRTSYRKLAADSIRHRCGIQHWTLHRFVKDFYIPLLSKRRFKAFVLLLHCVLCGLGIVGFTRIDLGLELTDVIPKGTAPYAFLAAREAYFSFYPFNVIIKGPTDYPHKQRLIRELRRDVSRISYVVKNDDGRLSEELWLDLMAKWLDSLQLKLDDDMHHGHINLSGIVRPDSASVEGKLAYKLLCNRGDVINCSRIGKTKLVDRDGTIEPEGFYNYITAWYATDPMTYYISQANFYPTPPRWDNMATEYKQEIPPAHSMEYSQIPFFATSLINTEATVDMIKQVREVCDHYAERGLPVFPEGIPFTFWEQYLHLWRHLAIALAIITGAVMFIVTLLLMSPWLAAIIVLVLVLMVIELAGFMGIMGLKLNPVSSVTLITAVGIGVEFTVHVSLSFLTALGPRNERMAHTLEHMFIPVLHGGLSTLLGVIMLAFSEFEFVVRYFFMVLSALIILGLLNGLLLLPVLLSLVGPKSEIRPTDGSNRLAPPTPPPKKKPTIPVVIQSPVPSYHRKGSANAFVRQSDVSLSTIAEEQTPPSSTTPPAGTDAGVADSKNCPGGTNSEQPRITVESKVMVHGADKVANPMTVEARSKFQVRVLPGTPSSEHANRRSTFGARDAPPPYSNSSYRNQLSAGNRRRNRSAGNVTGGPPYVSIISSPTGIRNPAMLSDSNTFASPVGPRQQSSSRRRIPSDSSVSSYCSGSDVRPSPQVVRF